MAKGRYECVFISKMFMLTTLMPKRIKAKMFMFNHDHKRINFNQ